MNKVIVVMLGAGLIATLSTPVAAQKNYALGVSDTEIKIGQTMPYSGPASALGAAGRAHAAYLNMINDQGGINGRKIRLISLDDAYNPSKTVEQTRRLVEHEGVALIFGSLGTAPNMAIHKYVNAKKLPHLFIASSSSRWNDPAHFPWTMMTIRPSFEMEGHGYAKYILRTRPNARIGVLYQNDEQGKDYLLGEVYEQCQRASIDEPVNHVKKLYDQFTYEEISDKIGDIVKPADMKAELKIVYQTVEALHKAIPNHLGDWYFTGDYPTPGGIKIGRAHV